VWVRLTPRHPASCLTLLKCMLFLVLVLHFHRNSSLPAAPPCSLIRLPQNQVTEWPNFFSFSCAYNSSFTLLVLILAYKSTLNGSICQHTTYNSHNDSSWHAVLITRLLVRLLHHLLVISHPSIHTPPHHHSFSSSASESLLTHLHSFHHHSSHVYCMNCWWIRHEKGGECKWQTTCLEIMIIMNLLV